MSIWRTSNRILHLWLEVRTVTGGNFVKFSMQNSYVVRAAFDNCDEAEDYKKLLNKDKDEIEKS